MTAGDVAAGLLDALRRAAGPDQVHVDSEISVAGLPAPILVRPGSSVEVAACLRAARDHSCAVVPLGGGTLQGMGFAPEQMDIVLDCSRLAGIVDWEPADLTAGVLAGTTLAVALAAFAQQGQQIAVDAPAAERATIGGLVAANVSGPRGWLYGGWRDQVIGMEMALSSGEIIKSGGRVVKNVQGYDLGKLFTGSLGTLGVITRINVKLLPLPEARCLIVARGTLDRLDRLLAEVAGSTFRVATLDLLDAGAAAACGLDGRAGAALLLLEGRRAFVTGQAARLARVLGETGLAYDTIEGDGLATIWERRLSLDRVDGLAEGEARLRAGVLPSDVGGTLSGYRVAAERHGLEATCWAEAGTGDVSVRVSGARDELAARLPTLQAELLDRLPSLTVVCGDPALQRSIRPWGADPPRLDLMLGLKGRFDPTRTLQPGRYVGGI